MTWEEARARLEKTRAITPGLLGSDVVVSLADIRAALERDEEQSKAWLKLWNEHQASKAEVAALRQRVEELERWIGVCGQCGEIWADRACGPTHAAIAHAMNQPGLAQELRQRAAAAEAEVERLRGLILEYEVNSPGCQSNLLAEAHRILARR